MKRKCIKCEYEKEQLAFVRDRVVCRLCWHDLPPEQKAIHRNPASDYQKIYQAKYREKQRLLRQENYKNVEI